MLREARQAQGVHIAALAAMMKVSQQKLEALEADRLQELFSSDLFRVYTNADVVGSELGGALKNVIALASGMADGLGAGDNTRAAVITRGLAELTRLGVARGGEAVTFAGLAGMGDLVTTCISPHSRNRHVGEQLGLGRRLEDTHYRDRHDRPKLVKWWAMEVESGEFSPNKEVSELVWLKPLEARERLSYDRDKELTAAVERG